MAETKKRPTKKAAQAAVNKVRSRIVGEGEVDPRRIMRNPVNWRTHTDEQRSAMREVMEHVGWVQRVVVNKTTGHLIDGHMRVEEAAKKGERTVPVVFVRLTLAEERTVLATFDPLGAMAQVDGEHLKAVLADVKGEGAGMRKLLATLSHAVDTEARDASPPPEVPFTEELLEEHNYIVLYSDNVTDWLQLLTLYPLRPVKSLRSKGKFQQVGQGRVVRVSDFLRTVTRALREKKGAKA